MNELPASASQPLWKLILHAAGVVETAFEAGLAPRGLSLSKLNVLAILIEAGEPLPLSRLAARLACVKSNVTQLVDRLESEGLVARVDDPGDRRSVLASITELGRTRYSEGATAVQNVDAEIFSGLDTTDRARFAAFLGDLIAGRCTG